MSWCQDHLSPERRREIAEALIRDSGGGKVTQVQAARRSLIGLCPLHSESNPSFGYDWGKDVFNCSGCQESGDLIKLFWLLRGLDQKQGFKRFLQDFAPEHLRSGQAGPGGSRRPAPPPPPEPEPEPEGPFLDESAYQALEQLTEAMIIQLCKERGWSKDVIAAQDLRLIWVGSEPRVAMPVRDEEGRLLNIRKYAPRAKQNKVLSVDGHGKVRLWPLNFGE
jgi:putative DNA primase/helicase